MYKHIRALSVRSTRAPSTSGAKTELHFFLRSRCRKRLLWARYTMRGARLGYISLGNYLYVTAEPCNGVTNHYIIRSICVFCDNKLLNASTVALLRIIVAHQRVLYRSPALTPACSRRARRTERRACTSARSRECRCSIGLRLSPPPSHS